MWIDESAFMSGSEARSVKRGGPQVYSDAMIQAVLTLKHVYHLTLQASQGFVQSLRELAFAELPVPKLYDAKPPCTGTTGDVARDVERRPDSPGCG